MDDGVVLSVVVSTGEFVDVALQMLLRHLVINAVKPAFQL